MATTANNEAIRNEEEIEKARHEKNSRICRFLAEELFGKVRVWGMTEDGSQEPSGYIIAVYDSYQDKCHYRPSKMYFVYYSLFDVFGEASADPGAGGDSEKMLIKALLKNVRSEFNEAYCAYHGLHGEEQADNLSTDSINGIESLNDFGSWLEASTNLTLVSLDWAAVF